MGSMISASVSSSLTRGGGWRAEVADLFGDSEDADPVSLPQSSDRDVGE